MEPNNSKERLSEIIKLSLLFLTTFIVFVFAIFFDYRGVPLREKSLLKEENKKFKEQQADQKKLFQQIDSISANISKLDKDPNGIVKSTVAGQLANLSNLSKTTSDLTSKLAINFFNAYSIILSEKQKVSEGMGIHKDNEKLEKEIKDLKEELKETKEELKDCQLELRIGSKN